MYISIFSSPPMMDALKAVVLLLQTLFANLQGLRQQRGLIPASRFLWRSRKQSGLVLSRSSRMAARQPLRQLSRSPSPAALALQPRQSGLRALEGSQRGLRRRRQRQRQCLYRRPCTSAQSPGLGKQFQSLGRCSRTAWGAAQHAWHSDTSTSPQWLLAASDVHRASEAKN